MDLIKGYSGNLVSNDNDLCYLFYKLKDNKYNNELIDINDNNYIFKKAPKTTDKLFYTEEYLKIIYQCL